MLLNKITTSLPSRILLATIMLLALYGAFGIYVYHEKEIDRANDRRQASHRLADQLRQSSDDLTRMARTYVITADPRYKRYFQDILDIRNGKIPLPEEYYLPYWDLVVAGKLPPPLENGEGVPLLELMRQTDFADEEINKLATAIKNSDHLTTMEFEAEALSRKEGMANQYGN